MAGGAADAQDAGEAYFTGLIARLDAEARCRPARYRAKVVLMALLGNLYLGAVFLSVLLCMVLLVLGVASQNWVVPAVIVACMGILGVVALMGAVTATFEPPAGLEIRPGEAPELFAIIQALRRRLRAPTIHHVLISDAMNACVVKLPRQRAFDVARTCLVIGLPMMKALSTEQFTAVLAHELGHLVRTDGRVSGWVCVQRLRWLRVMRLLEVRQGIGLWIFKPFLRWYAPYFNAYSFPLARASEFAADAASAGLTSSRVVAEALTRFCVVVRYLEEHYFPTLFAQATEVPRPACSPYSSLSKALAAGVSEDFARAAIAQAMATATGYGDTHPALGDRLAALGEKPGSGFGPGGAAADTLLGRLSGQLAEHLDAEWRRLVAPTWAQHFRASQAQRHRQAVLEARVEAGEALPLGEALQWAQIPTDDELAIARFQCVHARFPDDAQACLGLGFHLVRRGDPAACPLLEKAMRIDAGLTCPACALLRDFHRECGDIEEADLWQQRLTERERIEEAARAERTHVSLADPLEPHGLPIELTAAMAEALKAIDGLLGASLVRKTVRHFPERPLYVLCIEATTWYRFQSPLRTTPIFDRIRTEVRLPGDTVLIDLDRNEALSAALARVGAARIV